MIKFFKAIGVLLILALMMGCIYVFGVLVPSTDADMNAVDAHEAYTISDKDQAFHDSLTIADLHGDALLWRRNPEHRHSRGHIDLPRLKDGGVDIQIFSSVTKSPRGLNFDGNSADAPDDIKALAMAQLWPLRTWNSIYERAAFQAQRLQKIEAKSANKLVIARTKKDMTQPAGTIIGVLATEGSHPLEGELSNIERLYDEGYRMMGLQHFFDNKLGGSLHGRTKGGLTPFGREAVQKMRQMDIIVDLAHSSEQVARDVLALSKDPVIISHGGIRSDCANSKKRNLPNDILIEIGRRGGLLGVGYFNGAICDISPKGIARSIKGAVNLMGINAVALGSDFDGSVRTTLDSSELAVITRELRKLGMSDSDIRKIMGENTARFLANHLPD